MSSSDSHLFNQNYWERTSEEPRCSRNKLKRGCECRVQTTNKKSSLNLISDRGRLKNGRGEGAREGAKNKGRQ